MPAASFRRLRCAQVWSAPSTGLLNPRICVGTRAASTMSRRAVVLAGGKGSRLRPYTIVLPKPLMPIGEYPILEVILRQLSAQGFDRVTLAVNYQAEIIRAFCGDGSR